MDRSPPKGHDSCTVEYRDGLYDLTCDCGWSSVVGATAELVCTDWDRPLHDADQPHR